MAVLQLIKLTNNVCDGEPNYFKRVMSGFCESNSVYWSWNDYETCIDLNVQTGTRTSMKFITSSSSAD